MEFKVARSVRIIYWKNPCRELYKFNVKLTPKILEVYDCLRYELSYLLDFRS